VGVGGDGGERSAEESPTRNVFVVQGGGGVSINDLGGSHLMSYPGVRKNETLLATGLRRGLFGRPARTIGGNTLAGEPSTKKSGGWATQVGEKITDRGRRGAACRGGKDCSIPRTRMTLLERGESRGLERAALEQKTKDSLLNRSLRARSAIEQRVRVVHFSPQNFKTREVSPGHSGQRSKTKYLF